MMLRYLRMREENPLGRRPTAKRSRLVLEPNDSAVSSKDEQENQSENTSNSSSMAAKSIVRNNNPKGDLTKGSLTSFSTLPPTLMNFNFASTLNPYPERPVDWKLLFLKKRSRLQEIIPVNNSLLITLQHSGVCCVFKRDETKKKLFKQFGYLNHRPEEIVRSLFFNRAAQALVIVSVYPADKKAVLRCRSIAVADIIEGNFDRSLPILNEEVLGFPGWIELCDVNSRILTYSAETQTYKVWDLQNNYRFLFEVVPARGERLVDVKASPGFLLLIYEPVATLPVPASVLPNDEEYSGTRTQRISLLDIRDGREVYTVYHPVTTRIELVEQFCDSMLIKEHDSDLLMHNIRKHPVTSANGGVPTYSKVNLSPTRLNAFTFLHHARVFLTFQTGGRIVSFDANGHDIVAIHHEEEVPPRREDQPTIVLVSRDQETLLSVRNAVDHRTGTKTAIEFRHVLTGNLVARVPLELNTNEITCISYDEVMATLFVGTRDGTVHVYN